MKSAPRSDSSTPRDLQLRYGTVSPDVERGSLLLVSDKSTWRVVLTGDRKPVPVPAGPWKIQSYRIERKHEGVEWMAWGTNSNGIPVVVKEGEDSKITIDATVDVRLNVRRARGKLHLGFALSSTTAPGVSVVRDDRRPTPAWKVVRGGDEITAGEFSYG